MKWTVIAAVGAFVLSLAGSTAFVVLRAPAPAQKPPAAAKAPAAAPARSASPAPAAPAPFADSVAKPRVNAAVVASSSSAAAPVVTPATPVPTASAARVTPAAPPPVARLATPQTPADYAQVAKMLTSMKPAGATEIMSRLNDDQVEGILRALGIRQASTLLALFPGERAAALSRRLMQRPAAVAR